MELNSIKKDVMGEVGNISMSTAATALSKILNHQVKITTPKVSSISLRQIADESERPKVITSIEFKDGLIGKNLLMMEIEDAMTIAHLMLGEEHEDKEEFSELELSAVGEAMNQMIGSASTSLSTLLKKNIDILPPEVRVWSKEESLEITDTDMDEIVCKISFDLTVEGYVESEIMQIFSMDMVEEIVRIMLEDTSSLETEEEEEEVVIMDDEIYEEENLDQIELEVEEIIEEEPEVKVAVQRPSFPELKAGKEKVTVPRNLDLIMDVPLEFNVVLGKSRKSIKEILSFSNGSIVELDRLADEPLEIYVNGKLLAHGEVVVINENFGVRITNILTKEERVKHLR